MSTFSLKVIESDDEMAAALSVRRAVFIEEQGVPEEIEIDAYDSPPWQGRVVHVLGRLGGAPVATGRLLLEAPAGGNAHIGRVAVLAKHRGNGYGREVMLALQEKARELGYPGVALSAQLHAVSFYERLGYVAHGDVYLEAGIEHREMELRL